VKHSALGPAALLGLCIFGTAQRATAGLTTVAFSGERKLYAANDSRLMIGPDGPGTTFVAATEQAVKNTVMYRLYGQFGYRYERVDDTVFPGDRLWANPAGVKLETTVKYAANTENFGYFDNDPNNPLGPTGDAASVFRSVFKVAGNGFFDTDLGPGNLTVTFTGASGDATQLGPNSFLLTPGQTGSPLEFGLRSPANGSRYFSSNPTSALSGLTAQGPAKPMAEDHVITFRLLDDSGQFTGRYVLAWEDLPFTLNGADRDYNDLVMEVSFVAVKAVPEPSSLAIAGLGGFGLVRHRRRRARCSA
jgi:hypothetical protein